MQATLLPRSRLSRRQSCPSLLPSSPLDALDASLVLHEIAPSPEAATADKIARDLSSDTNNNTEDVSLHSTQTPPAPSPVPARPLSASLSRCSSSATLKHKLARVSTELARERTNLELAAAAGNVLLRKLDAVHSDLDAARQENARLRHVCAAMEEELRLSTAANRSLPLALPLLSDRRPATESAECVYCERHQQSLRELRSERESLLRRCLELERGNDRAHAETSELRAALEQREKSAVRLENERQRLAMELQTAARQVVELSDERSTLRQSAATLRSHVARLRQENELVTAELHKTQRHVKSLRDDTSARQLRLQIVENQLATKETERVALEDELRRLRELVATLESDHSERELLRSQVRDLEHVLSTAERAAATAPRRSFHSGAAWLDIRRVERLDAGSWRCDRRDAGASLLLPRRTDPRRNRVLADA
ncbi:hypothetical protein PINS_up014464 [Pythium insidiosum]|nr:hypothetical protein PINS_up014464 [Pythium insidiosum]